MRSLEITVREAGRVTVVSLTGRLSVDEEPVLKQAISTLLEAGRVLLVLNLAAVSLIDSAGLGALVAARDRVRAESPLPDGTLRSPAYMVRQPCQERGKAASSAGNMGAISVPSAGAPVSARCPKRTVMRRIAGAAELWFEKLQGR